MAGPPKLILVSSRVVFSTVVIIALLIGGNFTAIKFALDHTTPILMAGMRTVIGSSFLIGFALLRGERLPTRLVDYRNILAISLSITTISSGLLVAGIDRVPAGVASLISGTMPLFTAALSFFLLGTRIRPVGAVGLAVGFAGTIVLASPSLVGSPGGSAAAAGIGMLVVSALAWAFGNVYMRWRDLSRVSPVMLVGVQLAMSASVLVPIGLLVEGVAETDWSIGLLGPLLYAAIPANAVTFALLATVATRATPTQAASSAYLIPVFGVLFGWILRGERLGVVEAVGGLFVIGGVYLVVTSAARAPAER